MDQKRDIPTHALSLAVNQEQNTASCTQLHSQTYQTQVGSTSQNTCNTIASITVNSLLLKKPYSGRVQDSTKCLMWECMIEIHYHVQIWDRNFQLETCSIAKCFDPNRFSCWLQNKSWECHVWRVGHKSGLMKAVSHCHRLTKRILGLPFLYQSQGHWRDVHTVPCPMS